MLYINKSISTIALPLYTIAFIGFIENINSKSNISIEFFEKHNININFIKIILSSILSIILLLEVPSIPSAFILVLVYLVVSTVKLLQVNKNKQIALLWGIPIALTVLFVAICIVSPVGSFRLNRIIVSFKPEIDPFGAGWQGMEQKSIINSSNLFGKSNYNGDSIKMFNTATYNYAFIAILANYGWVLGIAMISIVVAFNVKLIIDSRKIKDAYGRLLMVGIACLFIFRSTFCLLMNLNLGIKANFDIPFISYDSVNLIMDMMSLAIAFSIFRRKDIMFITSREGNIV